MTSGVIKIGDQATINTSWSDKDEFPNCPGRVVDLRHGGQVAVIETLFGRSPRTLHINYLR